MRWQKKLEKPIEELQGFSLKGNDHIFIGERYMKEFSLITQLAKMTKYPTDVIVGIGDDAAVIEIPQGFQLVISTDALNEGIHFPKQTLAKDIGYKVLAVSLSDLAAMGAEPRWVLINLSAPKLERNWIEKFWQGLIELITSFNLQLVGGDTCRGPLQITSTVMGIVPTGEAITRSGARVGDKIYVTGTLGDAGLALMDLNAAPAFCLNRLNRPTPRVDFGKTLRGVASSAIDISDGLAQDLGHVLEQSKLGATIFVDDIPLSEELRKIDKALAWKLALCAGDDYELCFTAKEKQGSIFGGTCIGMIEAELGLRIKQKNGKAFIIEKTGYEHFS